MNSVENMLKPVDKMMKPVGKLLKQKNIRLPLIILLVVYISSALPELTRGINTFMNNLVIRLLVLAGVIYLVQKDILLALLLLTLYIMTSTKVSEYMENKKDKKDHGKKDHDKKDHDKKDHDKKEKDKMKDTMEDKMEDTMEDKMEDKMEDTMEDKMKNKMEDKEGFTLQENMEDEERFTNKCKPLAYNSPYNCYSNERNPSPCSPCGEVGAFDHEMSTQGLSKVMGFPGSELSKF